ncbi:GGDEF domain-containing protein [Sphingomonas sp. RS2018]
MKAAFERARNAMDFLEHHRLDPSPANYALALRYLAAPGAPLALRIAELVDGGLRLTAEQAGELNAQFLGITDPTHIPGVPAATAAAAVAATLPASHAAEVVSRQSAELGELTTGALTLTSELGRDVGAFVADREAWPVSADSFATRLSDAERELAEMRREIAALRGRITSGDDTRTPGDAFALDDGAAISAAMPTRGPAKSLDPNTDPLTDALNQRGARAILAQLAHYDRGFALVLVRLDDLAGLNERYGRAVGDNVLNACATTLRDAFEDQELIRWSGNEFVVVLMDIALSIVRDGVRDALDALATRRLRLRGSGEPIGVVTASAAIMIGRQEEGLAMIERARKKLEDSIERGVSRIEV